MEQISLTAEFKGDPSVGVQCAYWEIEDLIEEFDDKEHREETRKAFKDAFVILIGEEVKIHFSDEFEWEHYENPMYL